MKTFYLAQAFLWTAALFDFLGFLHWNLQLSEYTPPIVTSFFLQEVASLFFYVGMALFVTAVIWNYPK